MLGLAFGMILIAFILMYIVQKLLEKEKNDPVFAAKLNRFRDVVEKIPTDKIKHWIGIAIAASFLIYAYFFSNNG